MGLGGRSKKHKTSRYGIVTKDLLVASRLIERTRGIQPAAKPSWRASIFKTQINKT
jgi:hypothetical protein